MTKSKKSYLLAILVAGFCLFASAAMGQTAATLVGNVFDPTGAAIPGASVSVTNTATSVVRSASTDAVGSYRVYPLTPGVYDVAATSAGFKTQVNTGIIIEVGSTMKVDLTLEVGEVTESVEVTGAAPILQTQDVSVGGTVTSTELDRIPVNGRNYTRLILLLPGTSDQRFSQSIGTESGTFLVSVNGSRPQDNNFTIDGVDNNFMLMNSPGASPPMDAIQEFRVASNNDAEFGRSMGANVNMAIKSGTNEFHGAVYEYFRNDKLDANDFFANRQGRGKVPFRQNQYGAAIGGPVLLPGYSGRDRTFWFFNWEGFRRRRGSTIISNVPVPEQRTGDFSTQAQNIYDPFTSTANPDGTINRDQFPNNQVPQSMLHPSSQAVLDLMVPLPNQPGLTQNFVNPLSEAQNSDKYIGRFDHHQGENDIFSFRVVWQDFGVVEPGGNPFISGINRYDARNYMASWNHIFDPTSVLEVRFGYNDITQDGCSVNSRTTRGNFLDSTGITMYERDVLCDPIVGIDAQNEWSIGAGGQVAADDVYLVAANYSKVIGQHSIRFGGQYSRRHHSPHTANPPNGDATFSPDLTSLFSDELSGHSTATFLLGTPRDIRRGFGSTRGNARQNAVTFFAQDDWRLTNKLTLNFGLRYEYFNTPYDTEDKLGNLQFVRDDASGQYSAVFMWAGVNPEPTICGANLCAPAEEGEGGERNAPAQQLGFGRSLMQNDGNNFAPRVGIAYQLNDKTVIRTGAGVYYNSTFMQEYGDLRVFWPYVPQQDFTVNIDTLVPNFFIDDPGPDRNSNAEIGGWPQDPTNRSPYSVQWNLFIQRQLMADMSLEVGYVGSSSRKQVGYTTINTALTPGPGPVQPRRLAPNVGNVDGGTNRFGGKYNGLQMSLNKRFSKGIQFRMNYTWSKAMDEQSSLAEWKTQDPFNIRNDWGRSSWDVQHVFQIAYVVDLPFGRGRRFGTGWSRGLNGVLGGWSVEGYIRGQTGAPLNFRSGRDIANVGRSYQRPDVTCNPNNGPKTVEEWFDTSCLVFPETFNYGNAGSFIGEQDGRYNWDISILKEWRIKERHRVQFRGEFFNAWNSVSFLRPEFFLSSSSFGEVDGATDARQIQLVLRYQF